MPKTRQLSDARERISSTEWRTNFLRETDALKDFDQLVVHSLKPAASPAPEISDDLKTNALSILQKYPREDLRAARLHYNTQQLLAFWKHYCKLIEQGTGDGSDIDKLPLMAISLDQHKKQITLHPVTKQQLIAGMFTRTNQNTLRPEFKHIDCSGNSCWPNSRLSNQEILDSLQGRLTLATQIAFQSSILLYRQFLFREQEAASETWEAYRIHVFLDHFLYRPHHGHARTSKFELIFFANNLRELMVWLDATLKNQRRITAADVEAFLTRQTKFYLGLSQRISLEENEILNTHKELLNYDESVGIVRLKGIPPELLEKPRALYQELEMSSLGCPFGRAKGAETNALVEIYRYYDQLFAQIIRESWEFTHLFKQPCADPTTQPI